MKIALIGYGKMGKAIEEVAAERGHDIVLRVSSSNLVDLTNGELQKADVAIEFSRPENAVENIEHCFNAGVPVVVGTTGWYARLKDVKDKCEEKNHSFLYASNFSIGVNLFFAINSYAARIIGKHIDYKPSIEEIHHVHKLDAPSGTAITLAEGILAETPWKNKWALEEDIKDDSQLSIKSIRTDEVPGTHSVQYKSEIDTIELRHVANNRKGFALGAVIAAEWLPGKKGSFTMCDVLNI